MRLSPWTEQEKNKNAAPSESRDEAKNQKVNTNAKYFVQLDL